MGALREQVAYVALAQSATLAWAQVGPSPKWDRGLSGTRSAPDKSSGASAPKQPSRR